MIVLYIILSLLLLVAASLLVVALSDLKLCITYDNDLRIVARLLFIRYNILPSSDKKSGRKKPAKKKKNKKSQKSSEQNNKARGRKKSITETVSFISGLVGELLSRFKKAVNVDIKSFGIVIGGADDAARAAMEYGGVCAAAQAFLAYTDNYPEKVRV